MKTTALFTIALFFLVACKEERTFVAMFEVIDAQTKVPLKNANVVIENCVSPSIISEPKCTDLITINTDLEGEASFTETYTSSLGVSKAFRVEAPENYKAAESRKLNTTGESTYFIRLKPSASIEISVSSPNVYNRIEYSNGTTIGEYFGRSGDTSQSTVFTTRMIPEEVNFLQLKLYNNFIVNDTTLYITPKYNIENKYSVNF